MSVRSALGRITAFKSSSRRVLREPRKRSFFLEFTLVYAAVALFLSLAAGVAVTGYLSSDIRSTALDDVETDVAEVIAPRIGANLTPELLDEPLSGDDLAAFDAAVEDGILSSRTVLVNVYNADGRLVYSSGDGPAVRAAPGATLDGGAVVSDVGSPSDFQEPGLGSFGQLVEVAVPIRVDGVSGVAGAAVVYSDYTPIASYIGRIEDSVYISIAAALAALYLVLVVIVRRGSNAIRHQRDEIEMRTRELKARYESIVSVLCAALDLQDNMTQGHAKRVAEIAAVVAWQMGLRKEQLRRIEKASILHDIGKIGVADAVLAKTGPLDEAEWEQMKRHPELGYEIISGIDFLRDAAEVIHAHHERWDGTGYPRGLKGEDIPIGARIFAVVDAYNAMTSHRPYRKAQPHRHAVEEIVRNSGTQFDPDVVRAFLEAEKRDLLENRDGRSASRLMEPREAVGSLPAEDQPVSVPEE
jgi:HD-GYP domain-containing protein (c-di-GMP phosphodiesterase class II)